jgi:GAF domain-containing protein
MSKKLFVPEAKSKEDKYIAIIPQIKSLIDDENDLIANLSNITAVLKQTFDFFWVGFYFVKQDELVLGPFQGTLACTRIKYGKGVCGTAWKENKTIIVDDVEQFPGHIACNSLSRSEIVVPILSKSNVVAVLDVDSDKLGEFDNIDKNYLKEICDLISKKHYL